MVWNGFWQQCPYSVKYSLCIVCTKKVGYVYQPPVVGKTLLKDQSDDHMNAWNFEKRNFESTFATALFSDSIPFLLGKFASKKINCNLSLQNCFFTHVCVCSRTCVCSDGYGDWSQSGCRLDKTESGRHICKCNHLTNFAILMVRLVGHRFARVALIVKLGMIAMLGFEMEGAGFTCRSFEMIFFKFTTKAFNNHFPVESLSSTFFPELEGKSTISFYFGVQLACRVLLKNQCVSQPERWAPG